MVCTKTNLLFALHIILCTSISCAQGANTISTNQTLKYDETIVSPHETFELGFFPSTRNSTNYYIGIWYKKISNRTIVWVANRDTPITDNSSELTLTVHGVLVVRNGMGNEIWSSVNFSSMSVRNPIGVLLDTGNFVIYDESDVVKEKDPIWQSFDHMSDNFLPGMKHGWDLVTGIERRITAWKSFDDPASGEYSSFLDKKGYPQMIIANEKGIKFRAGPWNGLRFTGIPGMRPNRIFSFHFVLNPKEIYFQYNLINESVYTRVVLQPSGTMERLLWIDSRQEWDLYSAPEKDHCDEYNVRGPFGSCNINNNP